MDLIFTPWRSDYVMGDRDDEGCIFCRLPLEAPADLLHETGHWFVALNAFPYCNGHLMLVSKAHVAWLGELSPEAQTGLGGLLSLSETVLREAYRPEGMNMGINFGSAGGAGIPGHLHVHLLPRWSGDTNFMTSVGRTRIVPEELEQSFARLQPLFEQHASREE